MTDASRILFELARRVAAAAAQHPATRAAMVTGSVAKGIADDISDIDMSIYYEATLPDEEWLASMRASLGAGDRKWVIGDREEGAFAEAFIVDGIEVQIGHGTIAAWEEMMAEVLEKFEADTPLHKAMEGTLACVPLVGEEYIERWKARARNYPDGLAEAMVRKYLNFFPAWGLYGQFSRRDATVWYYHNLAESAQHIVGVMAGLNRLYFTTFQFKRMHRFIDEMTIAPPDLADRLEALFGMSMFDALEALEQLVRETVDLVDQHMPAVDTSAVRKRLGWRHEGWTKAV